MGMSYSKNYGGLSYPIEAYLLKVLNKNIFPIKSYYEKRFAQIQKLEYL
jgi:hypothetical protein